ncbi:MAG: hypothetical protein ACR2QC_04955 [Gammaproteobacteria bacterium]
MAVFYIFGYRQIRYCPQRQKEPAIPAKAGISLFTCIFRFNPPSHSCEGRNLLAEGGNCTISRRFAAAEIPTFAGMGRGGGKNGKNSAKKITKKVENVAFFSPFSDKIQFLLPLKERSTMKITAPPPPL